MYIFGHWQKIDSLVNNIEDISITADQLCNDFSDISINEIINVLDLLSFEWRKDSDFYLRAQSLLNDELSFSADMISVSLDIIPELLSKKSIEERLKLELNSIDQLDGPSNITNGCRVQYLPLGKILHVTAGNVFLGFLDSLIMGFITKNISFVKLSSSNQSFPRLLVESLAKVDLNKVLINKFSLLSWKGGDQLIEVPIVQKVDAVLGWGGEAMLNSYKKIIPYGVKLLDFGPKISFGILSQSYLDNIGLETVCNQITRDVCMWDQAACANMQNLYVESNINLNELIDSLNSSFSKFDYQIGSVSSDERVEILKEQSLALFDEMETGIKSEFNSDFNIRFETNSNLRSSPLNRTLIIKRYENLCSLSKMLKKFKFYLQTCGLGISSDEKPFISKLSSSGVRRFTKLGNMLSGVNGAPHDGRYVLRDLVNSVSVEFEQNPESFFSNTLSKVKFYTESLDTKEIPLISGETLKRYPIDKTDDFLNLNSKSNVVFTSGGTTGEPKYSMYSNSEFSYISELLGKSYINLGLSEDDIVANLFVAGNMWSSFIAIYKALESCSVTQLPVGGQCEIKDIIKYLVDFKVNTIFGIPSLLVELANYCITKNINLNIDKIFYAGEKVTNSQLLLFKSAWNVENIFSAGYASVDVGPIGYQTKDCSTNEHFLFDGLELEVINDECVVSSTLRKTMPVVRYKTGDKVQIIPHPDKTKFKILGRVDDMIFIWGARFSLSLVREALIASIENPQVEEFSFQISISTGSNSIDKLRILTKQIIAIQKFVDELINISEDIRNTLSKEQILNNLEILVSEDFIKNHKTGKTAQLVDLR